MDAYIYQADLYCPACITKIRLRLEAEGKKPENWRDETTFDSDDYPKGPFADGGGESDTPQHCGMGADCLDYLSLTNDAEDAPQIRVGAFLKNPLTCEGVKYVQEAIDQAEADGTEHTITDVWADFYSDELAAR